MHRNLFVTLIAATALAALAAIGVSGCSSHQPKIASSTPSSPVPVTSPSPVVAPPPTTPLPTPQALTDVLIRLADPNVPGIDKVDLVEDATPENAATLDKFTNALRDNGYLPMTFTAKDIAWSDKNPSNVMATISVDTAQAENGNFTFPMEFTPFQGGWQLSRRTAEMLLALGTPPTATPTAPGPKPGPEPGPEPGPAPAPQPTPAPAPTQNAPR